MNEAQREVFYKSIRSKLGALTMANVSGFDLFIKEAEKRRTPLEKFAYVLATGWWESGKTMQPVREAFYVSHDFAKAEAWRKKNLRYYPYYGRGHDQITWIENYSKASKIMGVDFVKNPDLIMDNKYSVPLTFDGLEKGWFTGKKLDDYIDSVDESDAEDLKEYINARRVVNGTNKAKEIGDLAVTFERALRTAGYSTVVTPDPVPVPEPVTPEGNGPAVATGGVAAAGATWALFNGYWGVALCLLIAALAALVIFTIWRK